MQGPELRFAWLRLDGPWQRVERVFEATQIGDWAGMAGGFTGTFWGVCCQDLATRSAWADFAFFDYRPI